MCNTNRTEHSSVRQLLMLKQQSEKHDDECNLRMTIDKIHGKKTGRWEGGQDETDWKHR